MTTISSAIAEQLAGVRSDELAPLLASVHAHALDKGLIVLPASVECDDQVALHAEKITAIEVLDAAAACGARAVYVREKTIDSETVRAALSAEHAPERAIQAELARIDGWTTDVEIGFALGGLAHVWAMTASWDDTLADLIHTGRRAPSGPVTFETGGEAMPKYLTSAQFDHWVAELAAEPAFRRAGTRVENDRAAGSVAGLLDALHGIDGSQLGYIVSGAIGKVRDLAKQRATELKPRLNEFAAAVAADAGYRAVTSKEARKHYATEWMTSHADHLRLPAWWIDDLVGRAQQIVKGAPNQTGDQLTIG